MLRARQALLDFLAASLTEKERPRATIVFDARLAPPDRQQAYAYQGLSIRFAQGYEAADDLIEELIKKDSAPRQLLVVSSDHRLQRAAARRGAKAIDSDVWHAQLLRRRAAQLTEPTQPPESDPLPPTLTAEELETWKRELSREWPDSIFPPGYLDDLSNDET
jgi:hypothetical protein